MKLAKVKKIINIVILITVINYTVPLISMATSFGDVKGKGDSFLTRGNNGNIQMSQIIDIFVPIGQTLVGIGSVVLVVVGLILGVKYMMAGPNDKARNKTKAFILCYLSSINIWCSRHIYDSNKHYE